MKTEAVPCGICGVPTPMTDTKRCDRCWELERKIQADTTLARKILAEEAAAINPQDARIVLDGFEKGVFIRSIANDDKPGWAIDLLPYLSALGRLQAAVDAADEGESVETQGAQGR